MSSKIANSSNKIKNVDDFLQLPDNIEFSVEVLAKVSTLIVQLCANIGNNKSDIKKIERKIATVENPSFFFRLNCLDVLQLPFSKNPSIFADFFKLKDTLIFAAMAFIHPLSKGKALEEKIVVIKSAFKNILADKSSCCVIGLKECLTETLITIKKNQHHFKKDLCNIKDGLALFFYFLFQEFTSLSRFDLCNNLLIHYKQHVLLGLNLWNKDYQIDKELILSFFQNTSTLTEKSDKNQCLYISYIEVVLEYLINVNQIKSAKIDALNNFFISVPDCPDPLLKVILENLHSVARQRALTNFDKQITIEDKNTIPNEPILKETQENLIKQLDIITNAHQFPSSWNWILSSTYGKYQLENILLPLEEPSKYIKEIMARTAAHDLAINLSDLSNFLFSLYSLPNYLLTQIDVQTALIICFKEFESEERQFVINCLMIKRVQGYNKTILHLKEQLEIFCLLFDMEKEWLATNLIPDFAKLEKAFKSSLGMKLYLYLNAHFALELLNLGLAKDNNDYRILQIKFCLTKLQKTDETIDIELYKQLLVILNIPFNA